jgi:hypothetical protein
MLKFALFMERKEKEKRKRRKTQRKKIENISQNYHVTHDCLACLVVGGG